MNDNINTSDNTNVSDNANTSDNTNVSDNTTTNASNNDNASNDTDDNLRIITYNLLSSKYSNQTSFTEASEEHLNESNRYIKITSKLAHFLSSGTIFCLQEVSLDWINKLTVFLAKHNYKLYSRNYGKESSGYMGVAIAVPESIHVECIKCVRVASLKPWPVHTVSCTDKLLSCFKNNTYNTWNKCRVNNNFLLGIVMRYHGQNIVIGNYHMPCAHKSDEIMVTHGCLSVDFLKDLSFEYNTDKIVFAGDFNSVPNTSCHKVITTGVYDIDTFNDKFPQEDTWRPNCSMLLRSAYKEHNGKEPDYTNNTVSRGVQFEGCIDYIFYTGINVISSNVLIDDEPPFPSEHEPSDHIMLLATFAVE